MDKKNISVIITTYKRDCKYVKEAIESAIFQTYAPIEIILVDDNGNLEYEKKLKKLCDSYSIVKYIKNEKNMGAQYSRNRGIMLSRGEYIAFLDDDDIWDKEKLEKQIKLFSNENVGMVYCDGISFLDSNPNKKSIFREASLFDRPISFKLELFNDYIGSTSQALIKKDCFNKVGLFDCEMPARQDYEMWLRISKHYLIVGVPEKLLLYRIHDGERISTNWEKCYQSYKLILSKYKADYDNNRYSKAKLILRIFNSCRKINKFYSLKYLIYAIITSPVCVYEVIKRRLKKKSFSEFYSNRIEKL